MYGNMNVKLKTVSNDYSSGEECNRMLGVMSTFVLNQLYTYAYCCGY